MSRRGRLLTLTTTVVARFRPQNKVEQSSGGERIVEFDNEETCSINVGGARCSGWLSG